MRVVRLVQQHLMARHSMKERDRLYGLPTR